LFLAFYTSDVRIKYYSGYKIKKNEIGRACSTYGGEERCIQVLVAKSGVNRPDGRPRRRWEDSTKLALLGVEWGTWNGLIWFRLGTGGGYM
jgi:hypothetical protein